MVYKTICATLFALLTVLAFWGGSMAAAGWEFVFYLGVALFSLTTMYFGLTYLTRAIIEKDANLLRLFWVIICCIFGIVFVVPSWYFTLGLIAYLPFHLPFQIQMLLFLILIVGPFILAALGFYHLYGMYEELRKKREM